MRIDVSARLIKFPASCACCGEPASGKLQVSASRSKGKRVVRTTTQSWGFPYCARCLAHVSAWKQTELGCITVGFSAAGVFLWIALSRPEGLTGAWLILGFGLGLGLWLRQRARERVKASLSATCADPGAAVAYLGWEGSVHRFDISSDRYATVFLQANERKLAAADDRARGLLQSAEQRQLEAARAAALMLGDRSGRSSLVKERGSPPQAGSARAQELDLVPWLERLEKLKGPAARRACLQGALAALATDALRQKLLLEASRIEVEAALLKADSLKTVAARRRTLQAALDEIRSDPVPDDMQQRQISWLEAALDALESDARES
jgi:hypothetical protein